MTATSAPAVHVNQRPTTLFSRFGSLARAELTLLLRNKVATFYAVALNPLILLMFATGGFGDAMAEIFAGGTLGGILLTLLAVMGITITVYYNLTTALVARREELVLKRLATGEVRRTEVLAAIAAPNVAILVAQFVLSALVIHFWLGALPFTNVLLALVGLIMGAIVLAELAFLTGSFTRTVESAQLSTTPGLMVGLLISGVLLPVTVLPDVARTIIELLPVYPAAQLVAMGVSGVGLDGTEVTFASSFVEGAMPLGVLAAWIILGGFLVNRYMKWEPRR